MMGKKKRAEKEAPLPPKVGAEPPPTPPTDFQATLDSALAYPNTWVKAGEKTLGFASYSLYGYSDRDRAYAYIGASVAEVKFASDGFMYVRYTGMREDC
jgi:hypothetical protein